MIQAQSILNVQMDQEQEEKNVEIHFSSSTFAQNRTTYLNDS